VILRKILVALCVFTLSIAPLNAYWVGEETALINQENWGPLAGDRVVFDTDNNIGYLIHENGKQLVFPIITGQKRYVYHLGMYYLAETPKKSWVVESFETQWDRFTYGPEGKFFRMYVDGKETHYGIHTHAAENIMFAREDRYQSLGCPIVSTQILNIIEQTFYLNGNRLDVSTI